MKTQCLHCNAKFTVPDNASGRNGKCPKCGNIFTVKPMDDAGSDTYGMAEATKPCPACGETILETAKKCKHCGEWLVANPPIVQHKQQQKVKVASSGKASQNAIAMFVMFICIALGSVYYYYNPIKDTLGQGNDGMTQGFAVFFGLASLGSMVFALIYLPLRWKRLMGLSPSSKILGCVGGFGLIGLFVVNIFSAVAVFSWSSSLGTRLTSTPNKLELYYVAPITDFEARQVELYLDTCGFLNNASSTVTIQLRKNEATYEFRMVVKKGLENDPSTLDICKSFGRELSVNALNGAKVDIHLCDETLRTLRVVSPL